MGVGSIVALSIASLMSEQSKRVQAISEKLLTKEIESQMKSVFSNADYCNCAFRGKRFNTTIGSEAIVAADQFIDLASGFSTGPLDVTPCTALASKLIPAVGGNVAGSKMTVGSISLSNVTIVSPTEYKADFTVEFQDSVQSMKPIKTNIQFSIDPLINTVVDRPFLACSITTGPLPPPPAQTIASRLGLDPNIWPDYIVVTFAPGHNTLMQVSTSIVDIGSGIKAVYYSSGYGPSFAYFKHETSTAPLYGAPGNHISGNCAGSACPLDPIGWYKTTVGRSF